MLEFSENIIVFWENVIILLSLGRTEKSGHGTERSAPYPDFVGVRTVRTGAKPPDLADKSGGLLWWERLDLNQRRTKPTDLQSAPFDHSGTLPCWWVLQELNLGRTELQSVALPTELRTHGVRERT